MQIFKHRGFHGWAKSEDIEDNFLQKTVSELSRGRGII